MDPIQTPPPEDEPSGRSLVARLRLRFDDPALEAAYKVDRFEHNLGNIRFAFLAGIALWISWGLLLRPHILSHSDRGTDAFMRYGVFIPLLLLGFGLSFTPIFRRIWEWASTAIAIATLAIWVLYAARVLTLPAEYGYIGVILITSFTYTLLRLRFVLVVLITLVGIGIYLPYAYSAQYIVDVSRVLATLYLISFGALGCLAAYRTERFTRQLFVRGRQLEEERQRSDVLLSNILPLAIIEQLKESAGGRIAQSLDEVSVVFVDAVGSTEQASHTTADDFAAALDDLFRTMDGLATRHGLEKIKTMGDGYLAVAGAPVASTNTAGAAVAMALDIMSATGSVRWPSGEPVRVRGGIATGPAVAGVIGTWKIAYDVWGDTVNLASRLEEHCEPGQFLLSEATASLVEDRFGLGPTQVVEIKGKGPTPVRALLPSPGPGEGDAMPLSMESS